MAIPITIPRLGWNMDEGVFAGWLKQDGDAIRAGDALFSLESEKATEEVECLDRGTLRIPPDGPQAGDKLRVGTVIGYPVESGEASPFDANRETLRGGSEAGTGGSRRCGQQPVRSPVGPQARR